MTTESTAGRRLDSARRHIIGRATTSTLLMRHGANVIVALTMVTDPADMAAPAGIVLLGVVGLWSAFRLLTRSASATMTALDFVATIAVCLAVPLLVPGPDFHLSNCAPIAVAGTAVVAFALSLRPRVSLPMTLAIAAAYAYGSARVVGWAHVPEIFNLYYFGLQWTASVVMRFVTLRVADAVDAARHARQVMEVNEAVDAAVRAYDREQTRLLHDTVASTLMLAGQGTDIPAARPAAQARRDLEVLAAGPPQTANGSVELVGRLRELAAHLQTPVRFNGFDEWWVGGEIGVAVIAAAREVLNNVDRHAHASLVTIDVGPTRVSVTDDGVGFDPAVPTRGFGLSASVQGRMAQVGGRAAITSRPGAGTTVDLLWTTQRPDGRSDPDQLIARTRTGFGIGMVVYAVLNVAVTAPFSVPNTNTGLQILLAVIASACTLSAIPMIRTGRGGTPAVGAAVLMLVALVQTMSVPPHLIGGQAQWSQNAIGWCLMPLLLRMPAGRASGLLVLYWFVPVVLGLLRSPTADTLVNAGFGTASILTVQLCVLLLHTLIADASVAAHEETVQRVRLIANHRLAQALADEYTRRYAQLMDNVRPLLETLRDGGPLDESFRRRARLECQRMRVLFDQSASFDHPLLARLRPAVTAAEERDVDVSVHVENDLPVIADATIERIVDALEQGLKVATTSARIALTTSADGLTASIVSSDIEDPQMLSGYVSLESEDVELTVAGDTAWLTIRCRTTETESGAHPFG